MISLLLALALAQSPAPVAPKDPKLPLAPTWTTLPDGGTSLNVYNYGPSSGGGGTVSGVVTATLDGGIAYSAVLPVTPASDPGTCSSVGAASATVIASNASRKAGVVCADSANGDICYFKFGATATTSNFRLRAGTCVNLAFPGGTYTGQVDVICGSAAQIICTVEF